MKKKKILIIGFGSIGKRHFKNLRKLGYCDISVCDINLKEINESIGKAHCYKNLQIALRKENPDVVFICTPANLHVLQANICLDFNCDLFIEKPISHNTIGLNVLLKKAEKHKRVVMVACNWRFSIAYKKLFDYLKSDRFGRPIYCRSVTGYYLPNARKNIKWRKNYSTSIKNGGGVILDSGSHILDYLIDLFGDIEQIKIMKSKINFLEIDSEEVANLLILHKNGILSNICLDYLSRSPIHKLEIVTSLGQYSLDFSVQKLTFIDENNIKELYIGKSDLNKMYINEIKYFMEDVKLRRKPLQGIEKAWKIIDILTSKNG